LAGNSCLAVTTARMFLFNPVNYQVRDRYTLLLQKFQITFCFKHTKRLGNSYERKTRLLLVVEHIANSLNSLAQVPEEKIDFVFARASPCKMRNHVAVFVAHPIESVHHFAENSRQA